MLHYSKTSHSTYGLKYHIVWITKYRKMKKAEIIVDNYKVQSFTKGLMEAGFTILSVFPFSKDVTIIRAEFKQEEFRKLSELIKKLEIDAKHSN